ncbi:MAG: putative Transposable element Tc3 transposase [Streblomastix strix]|uniref:Putative Transposable element Tc3 transposase n=1 Tax=Streblomastix strix TaxID=222440 RepID=A0A5J4W5H4_9EUKA|nr:MAG: putative Transposable element Tc3 transposase [Streblomastix strix]
MWGTLHILITTDACKALLDQQKRHRNFRDWIYFSDECIFELSGHINTYNCYNRASTNLHFKMEVPHKAGSLMVQCAISSFGLIGPIFLLETVTQQVYQDLIGNQLIPDLYVIHPNLDNVYFQQDRAPAHTAKSTLEYLHDLFDDRLIGKFLNFVWPPRSPDLTPPDFFLWGYLKDHVYEPQPQSLIDPYIRQPHFCEINHSNNGESNAYRHCFCLFLLWRLNLLFSMQLSRN